MKRVKRTVLTPIAFGAALVLLAACGQGVDGNDPGAAAPEGDAATSSEWPETIVYGVLPTTDEASIASSYEPFAEYMRTCLDHPFEIFTGANYTAMIEAMRGGDVHLGKFGAFSYILAAERANAVAFVQIRQDANEGFYTSRFITLESSGVESLADLEGKSVAFVDPTSTSGYMFPRAMMLNELGLSNEELDDWLGEVLFSGGHDASLLSVLNEDVVAAPISSNGWGEGGVVESLADHPNFSELVVFAETRDIPRTVEAFHADLPDDLQAALLDCFTGAIDQPELSDFLQEIAASAGYFPIDDDAYDVIRDTADLLGLSPEELLND